MNPRRRSLLLALSLCACRSRSNDRPSEPSPATTAAPSAVAPAMPPSATARTAASAAILPSPGEAPDGGAGACASLTPPRQLSFTGSMSLSFAEGTPAGEPPRAIFNQDGAVRLARLGPLPNAKPARPDAGLDFVAETATSPGCALAGTHAYCMSTSGSVLRSAITGEGARVVANARPGSSLAAATIAGGREVVAFLVNARTTEGLVTQAQVELDDGPQRLLSEDGSGATYVTLAPWREGALAVYIDERRALSPVHARYLSVGSGSASLDLGRDAVVFVGDGGTGRMTGAIATGPGDTAFGLVATARSETEFGLATIRIDAQLRDDAPTSWSTYPRSALSAPVEATRGHRAVYALRSRPASADPDGRYVLELGAIDGAGEFRALCVVAEGGTFTDPRLAIDPAAADDALWVAYTTAGKSWIERRGVTPRR